MVDAYSPTDEQRAIINHDGDAFVRACPGAGKTRTLVERARSLLSNKGDRRGVAFLSFTNAAVEELEARLRSFGILPSPLFPSFIGTFDRFLWQFFLVPFGLEGCDRAPRLVPDKSKWEIKPFAKAHSLMLEHFDRRTGRLLADKAGKERFAPQFGPGAWESMAQRLIERSLAEGLLDFDDVRDYVAKRLDDKTFSERLGAALSGRFREIVVDEAQDCNPADLKIVRWLRGAHIKVKVVCDPNQAIYAFRGGVTEELLKFADEFENADQLPMSGNFRSSPAICAAISQLRPPASRGLVDLSLGRYQADATPVYLLSYPGARVPSGIGPKFQAMAAMLGISPAQSPVLASTWESAGNAAGRSMPKAGNSKTLLLAEAVMGFHFAFAAGNRREALARLHRAVLLVRGVLDHIGGYHNYVAGNGLDDGSWRPEILGIGQALKLRSGESAASWLKRAQALLNADLAGPLTIGQRLPANPALGPMLAEISPTAIPTKTSHAVKGLEFPAVCVVLTAQKTGAILSVLDGSNSDSKAVEEARKIYVAASRAQRLLVIAVPKSRAAELKTRLSAGGHVPDLISL